MKATRLLGHKQTELDYAELEYAHKQTELDYAELEYAHKQTELECAGGGGGGGGGLTGEGWEGCSEEDCT